MLLRNINSGDKFIIDSRGKQVVITIINKTPDGKYTVETQCGKVHILSRETISTFSRCKELKEKKQTLLDLAVLVLIEENKPMKVSEILRCIKEKGYKAPRNGDTLECSLSSRLTTNAKECIVGRIRVKKLANGIFVHKDWQGIFNAPLTQFELREQLKENRKKLVEQEISSIVGE